MLSTSEYSTPRITQVPLHEQVCLLGISGDDAVMENTVLFLDFGKVEAGTTLAQSSGQTLAIGNRGLEGNQSIGEKSIVGSMRDGQVEAKVGIDPEGVLANPLFKQGKGR